MVMKKVQIANELGCTDLLPAFTETTQDARVFLKILRLLWISGIPTPSVEDRRSEVSAALTWLLESIEEEVMLTSEQQLACWRAIETLARLSGASMETRYRPLLECLLSCGKQRVGFGEGIPALDAKFYLRVLHDAIREESTIVTAQLHREEGIDVARLEADRYLLVTTTLNKMSMWINEGVRLSFQGQLQVRTQLHALAWSGKCYINEWHFFLPLVTAINNGTING